MNASDPGEQSTRIEREILEILERADASQTPVENLQANVRRQRASARARLAATPWSIRSLPAKSPEIVRIGAAILLAIGAAVIADASRLLAIVLAIGSAIAFFSLWVPARPSGLGDSPRWRGQRLDDDDPPFGGGTRTPIWRGPKRPQR